jgi:hypothetical protein
MKALAYGPVDQVTASVPSASVVTGVSRVRPITAGRTQGEEDAADCQVHTKSSVRRGPTAHRAKTMAFKKEGKGGLKKETLLLRLARRK